MSVGIFTRLHEMDHALLITRARHQGTTGYELARKIIEEWCERERIADKPRILTWRDEKGHESGLINVEGDVVTITPNDDYYAGTISARLLRSAL